MREWKDDYLYLLTDDTGMLQHSKYAVPDPRHGYTTDDNARALLLVILLMKEYPQKAYEKLLYRYTSFLLNAQTSQGKFKNFMSYERHWLEEEGSEDCQGRCIWALGTAMADPIVPAGVKTVLGSMLRAAVPNLASLKFLKAIAYALVGVAPLPDRTSQELVVKLGENLLEHFKSASDSHWKWFEPALTYGNSMLPWALFAAYQATHKKDFLSVAETSLDFLIDQTFTQNYFQPIGCNGWLPKGGLAAQFDQQPIEACETILTLQTAFKITQKASYLKRAMQCYEWYEGNNSERCCLIDNVTGGCYDGIRQNGANGNMGAESQISYGVAYFTMNNLRRI